MEQASHRSGGSPPLMTAATRTRHGAHAEAEPRAGAPRRQLAAAAPGHGMQHGGGPWERHAAWRLVLRAFRATAPAELQKLLRDEGVAAPDDP